MSYCNLPILQTHSFPPLFFLICVPIPLLGNSYSIINFPALGVYMYVNWIYFRCSWLVCDPPTTASVLYLRARAGEKLMSCRGEKEIWGLWFRALRTDRSCIYLRMLSRKKKNLNFKGAYITKLYWWTWVIEIHTVFPLWEYHKSWHFPGFLK